MSAADSTTDLTGTDLKIDCPARIQVVGPSQSGKSTFIYQLLKFREQMFKCSFARVYYCYPEGDNTLMRQKYLDRLREVCPHLEWILGLPQVDELDLSGKHHCLLILDDMGDSLLNSKKYCEVFFLWSHHSKLSLVYTLQNAFINSKYGKSISRNSTHYVIFPNKADLLSIEFLSANIFKKRNFVSSCFKWMEKNLPSGTNYYCFINAHPRSMLEDIYKACTNVFPEDDGEKRVIFLTEKE
jgi:Ni2+-binding GTPase involved in maturation of urease and hydrogenase